MSRKENDRCRRTAFAGKKLNPFGVELGVVRGLNDWKEDKNPIPEYALRTLRCNLRTALNQCARPEDSFVEKNPVILDAFIEDMVDLFPCDDQRMIQFLIDRADEHGIELTDIAARYIVIGARAELRAVRSQTAVLPIVDHLIQQMTELAYGISIEEVADAPGDDKVNGHREEVVKGRHDGACGDCGIHPNAGKEEGGKDAEEGAGKAAPDEPEADNR